MIITLHNTTIDFNKSIPLTLLELKNLDSNIIHEVSYIKIEKNHCIITLSYECDYYVIRVNKVCKGKKLSLAGAIDYIERNFL